MRGRFCIVAVLSVCGCVVHVASRAEASPAPAASGAPSPTDALMGCWKLADREERWRFARAADGSVEVSREVDAPGSDYARRAKIPAKLSYDAATDTFGFPAAGPIHALLFVFKKKGDALEVDAFTKHAPSEPWRFTGSHFTVQRCATP
jgi:hypothetical protein